LIAFNRFRRSHLKQSQNFDWRRTIRDNLKNYQPELQKLIIQTPYFNARVQKHLPWEIVLCVDQSGSMLDSVMYAAICASILSALPAVNITLVLFDTQVVDLSHLDIESLRNLSCRHSLFILIIVNGYGFKPFL